MIKGKLLTALAVATMITPLGLTLPATPTVSATSKYTLKVFPKRLQRTWYHYAGKGHYSAIKFTNKTIKDREYFDGKYSTSTSHLHYRKVNVDPDKIATHPWAVGHAFYFRKAHWTNVMGWNQSAGDGDFYKVGTKTYHGHKLRVLSVGGGAEAWIINHYYTSRKVAKTLGNKHFKGELYYPKIF